MRVVVTLVVLAGVLVPSGIHPHNAGACSCLVSPDDAEGMRQLISQASSPSTVMFAGHADQREKSPVPHSSVIGFNVDRVYGGRVPDRIVLRDTGDGSSCGMNVDTVGREFVVAREAGAGVYEPTYCGSFGVTPALQAELDRASPGYPPAAAAPDSTNTLVVPVAFAFGAGALVIGASAFILRRRPGHQP